ncbi:MAG: hypothetical protein IJF88_09025 [Oscillospiraceae bacterium]|nr:hypothetical protein [Oscillospiraceae bacterium]
MTAGEIIAEADALKPNAFPVETKLRWLDELEGRALVDVMLADWSCVPDMKLTEARVPIIRPPHDRIYQKWLCAKIDAANGDFDRYQNSQVEFNALWRSWVRFFEETYDPAAGYFL